MEWSGVEWSGVEWSGVQWSAVEWSAVECSGVEWSGVEWSGVEWSGVEWSGVEGSGVEGCGGKWSGVEWRGEKWRRIEESVWLLSTHPGHVVAAAVVGGYVQRDVVRGTAHEVPVHGQLGRGEGEVDVHLRGGGAWGRGGGGANTTHHGSTTNPHKQVGHFHGMHACGNEQHAATSRLQCAFGRHSNSAASGAQAQCRGKGHAPHGCGKKAKQEGWHAAPALAGWGGHARTGPASKVYTVWVAKMVTDSCVAAGRTDLLHIGSGLPILQKNHRHHQTQTTRG